MNQFPKRLVNLIGAILVIVVVVAGILLLVVPLFAQAGHTSAAERDVAASNTAYSTQIGSLRTEEERLDGIEQTLDGLRAAVPSDNNLDDVFELVAQAAQTSGVTVVSATAASAEAWVPRTDAVIIGDAGTAPTAPAEDSAGDATAGADGATGAPDAGATATPEPTASDPGRMQVPFTITVDAADPESATRFLDALGNGPRSLAIVQSALANDADGSRLTVSAMTFVHPGTASNQAGQ